MQSSLPNITAKAGTSGPRFPGFPASPYVGLRPFNSDEALLFFGRERQTIELLQQLHRTHFVGIVGSSGCGKSSLVRAGLIPKLKAGFLVEERDQWLIATLKPGDAPLEHLAEALGDATGQSAIRNPPSTLDAAIRAGDAAALLEHLTPALDNADANLLLLVDQFEELFRFGLEAGKTEQRAAATRFVDLLLALTEQRQLPVYVVLTMRSDFLGDCDNFFGLPEALNRSQYLVPRLTREQLRQAVEGPLHLFGASMTPALLNRILADVGEQSDQLPVLQHALMRTWEVWRMSLTPTLDIKHYEAVGTIRGALSRDADIALLAVGPENLDLAERIFRTLTAIDAKKRPIRRPAHLSELEAVTQTSREEIVEVLKHFETRGRSFVLLTAEADPIVDISHESLIRQWAKMNEWMMREYEAADTFKRLVSAARLQRELWHGVDLAQAQRWRTHDQPNKDWAVRYDDDEQALSQAFDFLERSRAAEQQQLADDAARKQREAELQQRQLRNARRTAVGLGVFAVVVVLFLRYANNQEQKAVQQEQKAVAQAHAKQYLANIKLAAIASEDGHSGQANLYLAECLRIADEAKQTNLQSFPFYYLWHEHHQEQTTLNGHEDMVTAVRFSRDGALLASASRSGPIRLWDTKTYKLIGKLPEALALVFTPDGRKLVSGGFDKSIRLWDIESRQLLKVFGEHQGYVRTVKTTKSGEVLATGGDDGVVKLWSINGNEKSRDLFLPEKKGNEIVGINGVDFSPDGKTLVVAKADGKIECREVSNGNLTWERGANAKDQLAGSTAIAFSPDGKMIASSGWDKKIKSWDAATGKEISSADNPADVVHSIDFSPDGKALVSASDDGTIQIWGIARGGIKIKETLKGHAGEVFAVAYSPDPNQKMIASGSSDKTVKIWKPDEARQGPNLIGHSDVVETIAFSPTSNIIASASNDKTVRLWDADKQKALQILKGHNKPVLFVTFSPDGKLIATTCPESDKVGTVKLWNVADGKLLHTFSNDEGGVMSAAFSPDGKILVTAGTRGKLNLWKLDSYDLLSQHEISSAPRPSIAFSKDGNYLALAGENEIRLLDFRDQGLQIGSLGFHERPVWALAFAPSEPIIASSGLDKWVRLWDVAGKKLLKELPGHSGNVTSVSFSPDGKIIASGSEDGTIRFWDIRNDYLETRIKTGDFPIATIAFSGDNKLFAFAGGKSKSNAPKDSTNFSIRLWVAATDTDVARQRNR